MTAILPKLKFMFFTRASLLGETILTFKSDDEKTVVEDDDHFQAFYCNQNNFDVLYCCCSWDVKE